MLCLWRGRARCLELSSGVRIECGGVSFVAEGQVGGVSSEAAQKAGGGAMSTRDKLIADMTKSALSRSQSTGRALELHRELLEITSPPMADALIAEGWRKKPDASEVAKALSLAMAKNPYTWEEVPTQMCPDDRDGTTKLVKTLHLNPLVDAVLALMDRGQ